MRGPIEGGLFVLALTAALITSPATPADGTGVLRVPVGDRPFALAVDSATDTVYVGNSGDGSISIVDGARGVVRTTVDVGGRVTDLAVNEITRKLYASDADSGTVTVLDALRGRVLATIAAGAGTSTLAVDEVTDTVYAAGTSSGQVAVIDGGTDTVRARVAVHDSELNSAATDPDRALAYFTAGDDDKLVVFDTAQERVVDRVPVGRVPADTAVHAATNTVFVANAGIHHLSVVSGNIWQQVSTILLHSAGSSVAVHQKSGDVYTNGGPNGLIRISGATGATDGVVSLGINPGRIAVNQLDGTVFLTDPLHDALTVIRDF
ncbi:DNA-binding beta-propeller fold protein YncE [Amycolatopsis marina]|uniref:DNA-binding beta-propeller fold protein YncE n=1 Tax=Amycolatopsis marina TaxID=490629 RepID=A0A1I0XAD3_9PSEU|nr:YncE family protein [Amycolatopsis marina]SFA97921.1 DNA-binding beta-propeller fold protein YncE [Amycolatopsis marina]